MVDERFHGYSADDLCVTGLSSCVKDGEKGRQGDMNTGRLLWMGFYEYLAYTNRRTASDKK